MLCCLSISTHHQQQPAPVMSTSATAACTHDCKVCKGAVRLKYSLQCTCPLAVPFPCA